MALALPHYPKKTLLGKTWKSGARISPSPQKYLDFRHSKKIENGAFGAEFWGLCPQHIAPYLKVLLGAGAKSTD